FGGGGGQGEERLVESWSTQQDVIGGDAFGVESADDRGKRLRTGYGCDGQRASVVVGRHRGGKRLLQGCRAPGQQLCVNDELHASSTRLPLELVRTAFRDHPTVVHDR